MADRSPPPARVIVAEDDKLNVEVWYENIPGLRDLTMRTEVVHMTLLEIAALGALCDAMTGEGGDGYCDRDDASEEESKFAQYVPTCEEGLSEPGAESEVILTEVERQWAAQFESLVASTCRSNATRCAAKFSESVCAFLRAELFREAGTAGIFLRGLHARVAEKIKKVQQESANGVFAKLSVRSAKDVVLQRKNERLLALWEPQLEERIPDEVWNKYSHLGGEDDTEGPGLAEKWRRARSLLGMDSSPAAPEPVPESPPPVVSYAELPADARARLRTAAATRLLETFVDASIGAFRLKRADEVLRDFAISGRIRKDVWRVLAVHFERWAEEAEEVQVAEHKSASNGILSEAPKLAVILRAFVQIPANAEFRVFVKRGRIVAASQYDHLLYCPDSIVARKDRILRRVLERFVVEKVGPHVAASTTCASARNGEAANKNTLATDTFVLDLAICGINEGNRVPSDSSDDALVASLLASTLIVEFNPFLSITSGCLFDWDVAEDRSVLESEPGENDDTPFEFRVVSAPLDEPVMQLKRIADCYRAPAVGMLDCLWPELPG